MVGCLGTLEVALESAVRSLGGVRTIPEMKLSHVLRTMALTIVLPTLLCAQDPKQTPKPLDYSRQADVNGKTIHFDDLHYGTVSPPIRESSTASPLSKGDLQLPTVGMNEIKPNSVGLSTLSQPVLPQVNYTAKRAATEKPSVLASRQQAQTKQNAPITNRVIRAFAPGGEEELKNQLNTLHP